MTDEVLRGEVVDVGAGGGTSARAGGGRRRGPGGPPRALVIGGVAIVLALLVAVVISRRGADGDTPGAAGGPAPAAGQAEAQAFLAAWSAGDTVKMHSLVSDPTVDVARDLGTTTKGLHPGSTDLVFDAIEAPATPVPNPFGTRPGGADAGGAGAEQRVATFTANVRVGGLGTWSYHGRLPLVATADGYRVVWTVAAIHPSLRPGLVLDRTRVRPDRAAILGQDDQPLVAPRPAVTIGIWPAHVTDRAALKAAVADTLHIDPASIDRRLDAPGLKPDQLVPLATITKDAYLTIRAKIHDIPGLNFPESTARLPLPGLEGQVLGRAGEITAEKLAELGADHQQGDVVGLSGLEAQFETMLGGTPSGDIRVVDGGGKVVEVLQHIEGTAPQPLRTTLDAATQQRAIKALAGVTQPAAFVAVDKGGAVRAAVSLPLGDDFNRAFLGQYPPGSTFKIVTAAALLKSGEAPTSPTTCPPTITVDGRAFHNAEDERAAQLSLTTAFADSCNTAFIGEAQKLPAGAVADMAGAFGFGIPPDLGVRSAGGTASKTSDPVGAAAAAIGQGDVVASPLHMATVAATVMSGQWMRPTLVTNRPPLSPAERGTAPPAVALGPLDPALRTSLDAMMHEVVQHGTGTKAAVAGHDVAGKTGTAEFGDATPPATHAWFVGYDGTLAVAVIVEGGGFGGDVAAPLAATFFRG